MIDLYKYINEGILDDENTLLDNMDTNIIYSELFSNNSDSVRNAINTIKDIIISSNAKQVKTTNKIKNSNSFFIQFPIKERSTYDMLLVKRYGSNWYTITIILYSKWQPIMIDVHREGWNTTQPNLSPKTDLMYEVPDHLNEFCEELINRTDNL